jgi:hypothetical protein
MNTLTRFLRIFFNEAYGLFLDVFSPLIRCLRWLSRHDRK